MPDSTLSLHRKLAQIMWDAERIPKRGKAPAVMGGYPFVQVGDAADFVRKALAEHVLSMLPTSVRIVGQIDRETAKGGNMTTVDLITTWTITDGESGESVTFESFGAGADGGDKYSGKASTSAMKYALLTAFLLSTGDDTEAHVLPEQRSERNPRVGADDYEPPRDQDGLIGVVEKGKAMTTDYSLRQTAEGGSHLGFRLLGGGGRKAGLIVEAHDALAEALAAIEESVVGKRVQVWGHFVNHELKKGGSYDALYLERIQTPDFVLPGNPPDVAPDAAGPVASEAEPLAERPQPEPQRPSGSAEAVVLGEAASAAPSKGGESAADPTARTITSGSPSTATTRAATSIGARTPSDEALLAAGRRTEAILDAIETAQHLPLPRVAPVRSVPSGEKASVEGSVESHVAEAASMSGAAPVLPPAEADAEVALLCGKPGPYSEDERCELAKGHKGPHKNFADNATWL